MRPISEAVKTIHFLEIRQSRKRFQRRHTMLLEMLTCTQTLKLYSEQPMVETAAIIT